MSSSRVKGCRERERGEREGCAVRERDVRGKGCERKGVMRAECDMRGII